MVEISLLMKFYIEYPKKRTVLTSSTSPLFDKGINKTAQKVEDVGLVGQNKSCHKKRKKDAGDQG